MPISRDYTQGAAVAAGSTWRTATGLEVCLVRVTNVSGASADITVNRVVSGGGNTRALAYNRTVPVGGSIVIDQVTLESSDAISGTASADSALVYHVEINGIS